MVCNKFQDIQEENEMKPTHVTCTFTGDLKNS